jgi:hypothetical protein
MKLTSCQFCSFCFHSQWRPQPSFISLQGYLMTLGVLWLRNTELLPTSCFLSYRAIKDVAPQGPKMALFIAHS